MSRKRAAVFNTSEIKAKIHKSKGAISSVLTLAEEFIRSTKLLMSCCGNDLVETFLSSGVSQEVVELISVATLGLKGVETARFAFHHVPLSYCNKRHDYIKSILCTCLSHDVLEGSLQLAEILQIKCPIFWNGYNSGTPPKYLDLMSLSKKNKDPYTKFICPPVSKCINSPCCGSLVVHNEAIPVTVFTLQGPIPSTKVSLRCRSCFTNYNYGMYGKKHSNGECFYKERRPLVEISDTAYAERDLYDFFCSLSIHCWVSFSGFSEVYFDIFSTGGIHSVAEFTRKQVSDMFYRGQKMCESIQGCGRCYAIDGNWKILFPHCMMPVRGYTNLPGLRFVDVCPEQPKGTLAFCEQHLSIALSKGFPTNPRQFTNFCKKQGGHTNDDGSGATIDSNEPDAPILVQDQLDRVFSEQGSSTFYKQHPAVIVNSPMSIEKESLCRKDLGEKGHWSRGHIFIVRSCGHIDTFKPMFKSESPSQVFLALLPWLFETVKNVPVDEWKDIVLAYDNMCHLDGLKATRGPLPLPVPYDNMWLNITKVIDDLHIRNHKDVNCKEKYSPKRIREEHPEYNFMVAEQTFVWLSRYKRILCSMNKMHHLFFLHRLVLRRNMYTEKCLQLKRKVLLPKSKNDFTLQ